MATHRCLSRRSLRRGTVIVQIAVMSTLIMGVAALAIDLGMMYTVQAELQSIADSAALAAASQLAGHNNGDPEDLAEDAANEVAVLMPANGRYLPLNPNDIEFGRAAFDSSSGRYRFQPASAGFDAVRVTARRDESSGGALALTFACVLGYSEKDLAARATATLVPRDIVVAIDLSNSMCYDSQLRYWDRSDGGYSNLRDIWVALNGPDPSKPYEPDHPQQTEYAGGIGPKFGNMNKWGRTLAHGAYNAANDPGLMYLPRYGSPSVGLYNQLNNDLTHRGYSSHERNALLNGPSDGNSDSFYNRICVLLDLGDWKSGKPGGKYSSGGNGNDYVGSSEMTNWRSYPSYRSSDWSWSGYTAYMMNSSRGEFRYRYGLKTFTNYLLDQAPGHSQTSVLCATPEQPLRAVKDAVKAMTDFIVSLDSPDQMGLVIFASSAPLPEVYLTEDLPNVPNRLYEMQSGHYDRSTNMGGGLNRSRQELRSVRARGTAKKVIVLMSDGVANVGASGMSARDYALNQAELAADEEMTIYTISVGYGVDRNLMQEIAEIGHGQEFYAVGNPEEYTEQLEQIFRSLGGKRPVVLIE